MYKLFTYKILLPLLFLLFSGQSFALTMTANVDRTTITINETLRLQVKIDQQGADMPDLSELKLQFDVLAQQQHSQKFISNGRISVLTQWLFIIAPKETGDLIIPSLSSLGTFSDAIRITVNPAGGNNPQSSNHSAPDNEPVYLESSVSKNQIYVQEQLLLTLRLYYRISLSGYKYPEFTLDNSTVGLTAESNYQKTVNGTPYNVIERVYAIHPQASGTITIPSQTWQIEKATNHRGFNSQNSPYLRLNSQPQTVEVLPVPKASTAKQWLPASAFSIEQQWQQSLITAKVGEPLTYTLSIRAEGLQHAQLPPIELQSNDDFTIYSDQAKTKNEPTAAGVIGSSTVNYAVIPKKAGRFAMPPIQVKWWNTTTDKEETITITPETIIVANSVISSENALPALEQAPVIVTENTNSGTVIWKIGTLLFACLTVIFLLLWLLAKKQNGHRLHAHSNKKDKAKTIHSPSLSSIYRDIEHAIEQQQLAVLKALLLQWCALKTEQDIKHTDDIITCFPDLRDVLKSLDKQLYSPSNTTNTDISSLLNLLKQQKKNKQENTQAEPLKALYQ